MPARCAKKLRNRRSDAKGKRYRAPAAIDSHGNPLTAVPAAVGFMFQKIVCQELYPRDRYPRHWFPELESIVGGLFKEAWNANPDFRSVLTGADESRAVEILAAELSLPSILARHPHALVMIYQPLISGFIRRLHRRRDETEDILQEILVRLFAGKLARIQSKYNNNFQQMPRFTSYFMVCVRNMYVDIVREGGNLMIKRDDVPQQVLEMPTRDLAQTCRDAFLDEEFVKLRIILQLFPSSREKMILCLKLKCRFAVTAADVQLCFPCCSADDIKLLGADFRSIRDRDMYRSVISIFNRFESKPVQADTLRKWVESKAYLLIGHLNRLHGEKVYDSENITDLLNLFFKDEGDRDQA